MQKKIIALAVAGLVSGAAFAQSNVTVYGNLDVAYLNGNISTKDTIGAVQTKTSNDLQSTGFNNGALSTNSLGFRGTEDLGNGLKATFEIELGLNEANYLGADSGGETDALGAFAFRKQNIGLAGGFGSATFGRQSVIIDNIYTIGLAGMKNNAVGNIYGSAEFPMRNFDTRASELMTYVSPNFSGFQVAAQYGTGNSGETTKINGIQTGDEQLDHTNYGVTLSYANGPLNVGFGYNKEKNEANTAVFLTGTKFDRDQWVIAANYDLGIVKVFGLYQDGNRTDRTFVGVATTNDRLTMDLNGWEIGVHVPVTAQITLAASYFDDNRDYKDSDLIAGTSAKGDESRNGFQLAALYSLSKRTTAYAMYGDVSANEKWKVVGGEKYKTDADMWAVGLKHSF